MADYFFEEEESQEEIEFKDDLMNYRGYFVENGEEEEKKFYEYGAHFPYMYLYQRLEILAQERNKNKKELENKLQNKTNIPNNINKKEPKDDPATNEESKQKENLKDLLNIFKQKGKSRNRGDVDIGLTYLPQYNRKKEEQMNVIDNIAAGLVKSSAGQKEEDKNNGDISVKNAKKNNLTKKEGLLGANLKFNNYLNKKDKKETNTNISNNKNKIVNKQINSGTQKNKIRKRNENKIWNINNSLNGNITISLNILNKTKFGDKNNSKNMTHDVFMTKINNNLINKLKSIHYSKDKLRKQILNTGKRDQNLNKKGKNNKVINKNRNSNNKGSYSNYYGYQNTKNTSSSKNMVNNNSNKKTNKTGKIGISSNINLIKEKMEKKNTSKNLNIRNNIQNHNIINSNTNNNQFMRQNKFLKNLNKNKNIIINKNPLKKTNLKSKNNISINNNNPKLKSKNQIPNTNNTNIHINNENIKSSNVNRKQYDFIDNIGSKKDKNNISRNNAIPIFNNQIQSTLNKNFHSVNNAKKGTNKMKPNYVNINLTNNFNNLNQQFYKQNPSKIKESGYKYNKNCSSNVNLKKYSQGNSTKKKSGENNNVNQKNEIQKKKNINNIQDKFKSYILKLNDIKNNINMNINKKISNKSTFKNNAILNIDNNKKKEKEIVSRNRNDNNNANIEKNISKKNNTMIQNKKKHHININININNQQNIILNKLGNALNNNSINICSVRSSNNKEINNNKNDKNIKNGDNYFI